MISTGSTFQWNSSNSTSEARNPARLNSVTNNKFQTNVTAPAVYVPYLTSASNLNSFTENVILIGDYGGGILNLNPLGPGAFEFNADFLIQNGSTVNVNTGTHVQIDDNVALTVDGTFNVNKAASFKIFKSGFFDAEGITVESGGLISSNGVNYSQVATASGGIVYTSTQADNLSPPDRRAIQWDTNSTSPWPASSQVQRISPVTHSKQLFRVPSAATIPYLTSASNKNAYFDNVILIGDYSGVAALILNPLDCRSPFEFNGNFLIPAGSTVTVNPGTAMQIDDNAVSDGRRNS